MKCLIDPTTYVEYISEWVLSKDKTHYNPVFTEYPNSARVCQVQESSFEVAPPLFWVDCADDVVADMFWYNKETEVISPIVDAPEPPLPAAEDQPTTNGTQTL